jgi:hypothetical protein
MSFDDDLDDDLDDEDGEGGEGGEGEFEVNIDPREDDLERLGIDPKVFEKALMVALEAQGEGIDAGARDDVARSLEDLPLTIAGKTYRLGDLADVSSEEAGDDDEDLAE